MAKGQRVYCSADHSASKSDQDADRWCEMYHYVELPDPDRPRTYQSDALGAVTIPEDEE